MRKLLCGLCLIAFFLGSAQADPVSITVIPALAPNVYGSPSYAGWETNAVYALGHGLSGYGAAGSPTYYQAGDTYNSAQVIVTGFPSYKGLVDPGTVFGDAYKNELGNRMHFGLIINGNGTQFSISQLSFSATSTDPYNGLAFSYAAGGYNYGSGYLGVVLGADGILWTADDTYITGGANTQLVDMLFGRGSGNSYAAYCDPGPCTLEQQQALLYEAAYYPGTMYQFTGTYTLTSVTGGELAQGSGTFTIDPVPEPAAFTLAGLGLLLLAASRFRARAR